MLNKLLGELGTLKLSNEMLESVINGYRAVFEADGPNPSVTITAENVGPGKKTGSYNLDVSDNKYSDTRLKVMPAKDGEEYSRRTGLTNPSDIKASIRKNFDKQLSSQTNDPLTRDFLRNNRGTIDKLVNMEYNRLYGDHSPYSNRQTADQPEQPAQQPTQPTQQPTQQQAGPREWGVQLATGNRWYVFLKSNPKHGFAVPFIPKNVLPTIEENSKSDPKANLHLMHNHYVTATKNVKNMFASDNERSSVATQIAKAEQARLQKAGVSAKTAKPNMPASASDTNASKNEPVAETTAPSGSYKAKGDPKKGLIVVAPDGTSYTVGFRHKGAGKNEEAIVAKYSEAIKKTVPDIPDGECDRIAKNYGHRIFAYLSSLSSSKPTETKTAVTKQPADKPAEQAKQPAGKPAGQTKTVDANVSINIDDQINEKAPYLKKILGKWGLNVSGSDKKITSTSTPDADTTHYIENGLAKAHSRFGSDKEKTIKAYIDKYGLDKAEEVAADWYQNHSYTGAKEELGKIISMVKPDVDEKSSFINKQLMSSTGNGINSVTDEEVKATLADPKAQLSDDTVSQMTNLINKIKHLATVKKIPEMDEGGNLNRLISDWENGSHNATLAYRIISKAGRL